MQLPRYRTPASSDQERARTLALRRGWRRAALLSGAALAIVAAPVALASSADANRSAHVATLSDNTPIKGAIHNPASSSYLRTTGIFANYSGWTTRIQNVGSGGAGTFGCKANGGGASACLASENSKGGLAFTFATTGATGGEILLTNPSGAPFTTNAHGEAKGLNANYLQGKEAKEFQLANQPAANANELGGKPASEYAVGGLMFADVSSTDTILNTRGASAVAKEGESFKVTFGTTNVSNCSFTASPTGAALSSGQISVEPSAGNASTMVVNPPSGFSGGFDLQVIC
jgi:hypothetical protein